MVFDAVILGAGIAGASLAFRLAGQRSVLLLERESQRRRRRATWRPFGGRTTRWRPV